MFEIENKFISPYLYQKFVFNLLSTTDMKQTKVHKQVRKFSKLIFFLYTFTLVMREIITISDELEDIYF